MTELTTVLEKRGNTNCFSEANFNHLLVTMKDRTYPEGTHLYWEGDVSDKLYYMKRGRAQITKSTDEGKELIMYMYQSGDMIGQADPFLALNTASQRKCWRIVRSVYWSIKTWRC